MAQRLSAKEAAIQLGTSARTLRKFLRSKQSPISPVGQGNRYEFDTQDMKRMKKAFLSWSNGTTPHISAKTKTKIEDLSTDEKDEYAKHLAQVEEGIPDLEDLDEPSLDDLIDIEEELEIEEIE